MIVTKKELYKDANSNNNSDKEDQDHIAIFMDKDDEISREQCHLLGVANNYIKLNRASKYLGPKYFLFFLREGAQIFYYQYFVYHESKKKMVAKNTYT